MPKFKQATISSLKGVVVVEDFKRHQNVLENDSETKENILSALSHLRKKKPSKEVISSIGIDKSLAALQSHPDVDISAAVLNLCKYWELDSDKIQPTVEVRYDNLTLHIRKTAVKLFTEAFGGTEEDEKLADKLEKELFYKHKRLISKDYRKCVRKVAFTLKHKEAERNELKQGKTTQVQFIKKHFPNLK